MKSILLFISVIYYLYVVAQTSEQISVHVKQIDSDQQIMLKYDTARNYVWAVSFPFEYELKDCTPLGTWIRGASFYYAAEFSGTPFTEAGWLGIPYWIKFDGKYGARPDLTELKERRYPNPSYYLVRSTHNVTRTSDIQDSLAQYVQKMKDAGGYTMSIGTLGEFKAKHPQLTDRFLKGDSVRIMSGYNKQTKFYEWIHLPIEY